MQTWPPRLAERQILHLGRAVGLSPAPGAAKLYRWSCFERLGVSGILAPAQWERQADAESWTLPPDPLAQKLWDSGSGICIGPSGSVTCTFPFETSDLEGQVHQGFHEIVAEVQHIPRHVLLCSNLLPRSRDVEPCVLSIRAPSCSLGAQDRDGSGPSLCPRLVLPGAYSASGALPSSQQQPTLSVGEHWAAVSRHGQALALEPSHQRKSGPLPPAQLANREASVPAA